MGLKLTSEVVHINREHKDDTNTASNNHTISLSALIPGTASTYYLIESTHKAPSKKTRETSTLRRMVIFRRHTRAWGMARMTRSKDMFITAIEHQKTLLLMVVCGSIKFHCARTGLFENKRPKKAAKK